MIKYSGLTTEERNLLIAEKVFGLERKCTGQLKYVLAVSSYYECPECKARIPIPRGETFHIPQWHTRKVPSYSTDMNALLSIITSHKFMKVEIEYTEGWRSEDERWQCYECIVHPYEGDIQSEVCEIINDAVLIAALKAVGVEIEP